MKWSSSIQRFFLSLIALTNTQRWAARFMKAETVMPRIFVSRYAWGAGISQEEAHRLYSLVPSLESHARCNYWLEVGSKFEAKGQYQAACMSYILGAFPNELYPWKKVIYERQKLSFQKWCEEKKLKFESRIVQTPEGKVHYYLYQPENSKLRRDGKVPVTIFINGLEGSSEEIVFGMLPHIHEGMAYALLSCPGSPDYEMSMTANSERTLSRVVDDLVGIDSIDANRIGMVGFSFGAYWAFICAKTDSRIRFTLCNGMPYRYTFNPEVGFGVNPIIAYSLLCVFRVWHPFMLIKTLKKLVQKADALFLKPSGPILAINGDGDTIVDTRDTELIGKAPGNRLLFLKNDDHCGLIHYPRMIQIIMSWTKINLRQA